MQWSLYYQSRPRVTYSFTLGTVISPAMGGAFASSSASWRWVVYTDLVIGGIFGNNSNIFYLFSRSSSQYCIRAKLFMRSPLLYSVSKGSIIFNSMQAKSTHNR